MFQDHSDAGQFAVIRATYALILVIAGATAATIWLVLEVKKEQQTVREILEKGNRADIQRLGSLPDELRWQLLFTILVLLVLLIAAIALFSVARAYLTSQTSLGNLKMLAWHILASTDQGVITTDCEGRITSVNPRGEELLGLKGNDLGRSVADVLGDSSLVDASQRVLKSRRAETEIRLSMLRDGHETRLRVDCHLLHGTDDAVLGTVFHIRDVTERMLMENRIRRMERFMGLGTLAAGLHHEIKNPLSALSLHVQLLEERLDQQADHEVAESLGVLKTEVTRIAGVLENFRDYASTDRMNVVPTDVGKLLRHIVDLMRPKAEHQHVEIELDLPEQPLAEILLDPVRFEQVLLNLVINALDVLPSGGKITLAAECAGSSLHLDVADTGSGIPDNIRSRIFDPYFTTKSGGSGMGLAVCDKIIRQHGGELDLETSPSGTVFRIALPAESSVSITTTALSDVDAKAG